MIAFGNLFGYGTGILKAQREFIYGHNKCNAIGIGCYTYV